MARFVIDEELRRHHGLGCSLTETVDHIGRGNGSQNGLGAPVSRVVGVGVIGGGRGMAEHVAVGVIGEAVRLAAADAEQAIARRIVSIGQRDMLAAPPVKPVRLPFAS